jgi:hypothetical protein
MGDVDDLLMPAERPWMKAIRRHVEEKTFVARSELLEEM